MRLSVSREDRPDVGDKAEGVQDGQQVEERGVVRVVEPGLDRYSIVGISSVRTGRVVQDKDGGEVGTDGGEVLGVRPKVEGAVLAIVASPQHSLAKPIIHSLNYSRNIYLIFLYLLLKHIQSSVGSLKRLTPRRDVLLASWMSCRRLDGHKNELDVMLPIVEVLKIELRKLFFKNLVSGGPLRA